MAGRMVYVRQRPKRTSKDSGHWPETKKVEALTYWLATKNLTETSMTTGVPYETLQKWKASDWWKDKQKQLEGDELDQLDKKLSKAVDRALDNLIDRIENGESMYDPRTGEVRKVPAKLRDLNVAFNTVLDKRQLLRKQPTKIVEQQTTATQLQNLAQQFAQFVTGKPQQENIKDVQSEFIEGQNIEKDEDGKYYLKETS